MNKNRLFVIGSLICNLFIGITLIYCVVHNFLSSGGMPVGEFFKYFTNLSNILIWLVCIIFIPFNINNIVKGINHYPKWLRILKFIAVVGVTITLLTVLCYLGPTQGFAAMLSGDLLFLHLLNPLVAIIGLILFESNDLFKWPYSITGISTVAIYGIVYLINVLVTKTWDDFYGLNIDGLGGLMYLIFVIITFGVSEVIYFLQKLICRIWHSSKNRKTY